MREFGQSLSTHTRPASDQLVSTNRLMLRVRHIGTTENESHRPLTDVHLSRLMKKWWLLVNIAAVTLNLKTTRSNSARGGRRFLRRLTSFCNTTVEASSWCSPRSGAGFLCQVPRVYVAISTASTAASNE